MTSNGKIVASLNGYTVREVFVQNADGSYTSVGFGVFGPDGILIAAFPTVEEAIKHMNKIAKPTPPRPHRGM